VGFLAVSLEPDEALVKRAVAQWEIGGTVATAVGEMLGPLSVAEIPSTVFVDANGVIVAAASGPRSVSFLKKRTEALLQDSLNVAR
jgi:hypothetical protein